MKISGTPSSPTVGGAVSNTGEATSTRQVGRKAAREKPASTAAGGMPDQFQQTPEPTAFERLIGPSSRPVPDKSNNDEPKTMSLNGLVSSRQQARQLASKILREIGLRERDIIKNTGR